MEQSLTFIFAATLYYFMYCQFMLVHTFLTGPRLLYQASIHQITILLSLRRVLVAPKLKYFEHVPVKNGAINTFLLTITSATNDHHRMKALTLGQCQILHYLDRQLLSVNTVAASEGHHLDRQVLHFPHETRKGNQKILLLCTALQRMNLAI